MNANIVEQLMRDSLKALRKYQRLERAHRQLVCEIATLTPNDPRQPELERKKRLVLREKIELAGPFYVDNSPARRDGAHSQEG